MQTENLGNPVLEQLCDSLLTMLEREIPLHQELHAALKFERETLIRPSIESLNETNSRKETCLLKLRIIEEARMGIIRKIAARLGLPEREVNISRLGPLLDERRKLALSTVQDRLQNLLEDISSLNRTNKSAIEASINHVQGALSLLGNLLSNGAAGYSPNGLFGGPQMSGQVIETRG